MTATLSKPVEKPATDRIEWLGRQGHIDRTCLTAAARLVQDCELAGKDLPSRNHSHAASGAAGLPTQMAVTVAKARVESAQSVLGPILSEILTLVVLRNIGLSAAAAAMGIHQKAALPLVRAGLQVLSAHYAVQRRG